MFVEICVVCIQIQRIIILVFCLSNILFRCNLRQLLLCDTYGTVLQDYKVIPIGLV